MTHQLRIPARTIERLREELLQDDEDERFAFLYCGSDGDQSLASRIVTVEESEMAVQRAAACRPDPAVERDRIGECAQEQLHPLLVHSHPFSEHPGFSGLDVSLMDDFEDWITGLYDDLRFGFVVLGTRGQDALIHDGDGFEPLQPTIVGEWKLDQPLAGATSAVGPPVTPSDGSSETTRSRIHGSSPFPDSTDEQRDARRAGGFDGDANPTSDAQVGETKSETNESTTASSGPDVDRSLYDRNLRALTVDGQRRIGDAKVAIVGVGGLGSQVAEQLVRMGVSDLVIVDPDEVERHNLPRLFGAAGHHVGKPKVDVIQAHLWRSSPDEVDVRAVEATIEDCPEVLADRDVIISCVDRVSTRNYLNEWAVKHLRYLLDAGVRIDVDDAAVESMTGYLQLVAPGANACFDCLGRHDSEAAHLERLSEWEREREFERGYVEGGELAPEPAVVHLNGVVASKAVGIISELVAGYDTPPDFLRYESLSNEFVELTTSPSEDCPACGADGVLGVGERSFGGVNSEIETGSTATD